MVHYKSLKSCSLNTTHTPNVIITNKLLHFTNELFKKCIRVFLVCAVANSDSIPKPLLLIPVTLTVYAVLEVRFSSLKVEILDPSTINSSTGSPHTVVKFIFQAVGKCVVLASDIGCYGEKNLKLLYHVHEVILVGLCIQIMPSAGTLSSLLEWGGGGGGGGGPI